MPPIHSAITLGRTLHTSHIDGLAVHEIGYAAGRVMPTHAHERANVTFVLDGAIEETALGRSRRFGACDAVLKPAGTMHSNRFGPRGARSIVIELDRNGGGCGPFAGAAYAAMSGVDVIRAAACAMRLLHSADGRAASAAAALREALVELAAANGREQRFARDRDGCGNMPWLDQVRGLLHEGYARPLRVQDIAALLQLHPVYVARAFRRRHGCAMTAYRRRLQVMEASRRLTRSDEPLAAIALRCGFADQSHFTRAFRAALGLSPGEFRRLASA